MSQYLVVVLVLVVFLYEVNSAAIGGKGKCDEAEKKKIDQVVAQIMTVGRSDIKFPEEKDDVKAYCK